MSNLVWSPAIEKIRALVKDGNLLTCCISAFATADVASPPEFSGVQPLNDTSLLFVLSNALGGTEGS